jgi:hypothetical protein
VSDYIVAIDLAREGSVDHHAVETLLWNGERWVVVDDPRHRS